MNFDILEFLGYFDIRLLVNDSLMINSLVLRS
jgi:hypothetical protein